MCFQAIFARCIPINDFNLILILILIWHYTCIFHHEDRAHLLLLHTTRQSSNKQRQTVRLTTASTRSPMDTSISNRPWRTNQTITSWWASLIILLQISSQTRMSMVDINRSALTNALVFFTLIEMIKDATRTNKRDISNFSSRILQFQFDSVRFGALLVKLHQTWTMSSCLEKSCCSWIVLPWNVQLFQMVNLRKSFVNVCNELKCRLSKLNKFFV